ncbi:MAG: universal stress protein [Ilyomonas sp.]
MNNVIVPIDFSETSLNAARYAVKLFSNHPDIHLRIYNMFEKESEEAEIEEKLSQLKEEYLKSSNANVTTNCERGSDFIASLERFARYNKADLIIMGLTGRSALAQVFVGSNTLKMVDQKVCPVLIIPANLQYRDIDNVMLASDFKNVLTTTPVQPIKDFLKVFKPHLHVVNVDSEHYIAITEEYEKQKQNLMEMFADFNPEFYFLRLYDVEEALHLFAEEKKIDLIISIPKDHSLSHKLFRSSHTKNLSYKSNLPVLAVHE